MRQAALLLSTAVVVGVSVTAAGCGGGGGGGGERLSKSEFIAKADGICGEANKKVPKPPADLTGVDPTSSGATDKQLDKFGDYIEDVTKVLRGEVDDLHDLKPPQNLQNRWDRALAVLDEALNELDDAAQAAHDADRKELKDKLTESDGHSSQANGIARTLGLKVCGSS